jgi:hypothetical protein
MGDGGGILRENFPGLIDQSVFVQFLSERNEREGISETRMENGVAHFAFKSFFTQICKE